METGADEKSYRGLAFGSRNGKIGEFISGVTINGLGKRGKSKRGIRDGNNDVPRTL